MWCVTHTHTNSKPQRLFHVAGLDAQVDEDDGAHDHRHQSQHDHDRDQQLLEVRHLVALLWVCVWI